MASQSLVDSRRQPKKAKSSKKPPKRTVVRRYEQKHLLLDKLFNLSKSEERARYF